jgi:hypothetical protein
VTGSGEPGNLENDPDGSEKIRERIVIIVEQ